MGIGEDYWPEYRWQTGHGCKFCRSGAFYPKVLYQDLAYAERYFDFTLFLYTWQGNSLWEGTLEVSYGAGVYWEDKIM